MRVEQLKFVPRKSFYGDTPRGVSNVDWFRAGTNYALSKIDGTPKASHGYYQCMGVAVVGESEDQKPVSFLSHQSPGVTRDENREHFEPNMRAHLRHIKKISRPGSIRAVIFGGVANDKHNLRGLLQRIVRTSLGVEPAIIKASKEDLDPPIHAALNTRKQKLTLLQEVW